MIIFALAVSLGFFFLSFYTGNFIIDRKKKLAVDEKVVADFQSYIEQAHLKSVNRKEIVEWCRANEVDIEVFVDEQLVFSSVYGAKKAKTGVEETGADKEKAHQIRFDDTEANVVFYPYLHIYIYGRALIVEIIVSALLFFAIIINWIRKDIEYIHRINEEIHVLEGGDLTREITIRGDDEISMLAQSVNEFRISMRNQLARIEQLEKNNRLMSAEIAHDLRTPLTSQMMYLDFAQKEIEGKEPTAELYISKAREKSIRLKNLMDQYYSYTTMRDYFLIEKQSTQAYEVLNGYLGDITMGLESEGFNVRSDIRYGHSSILIQREAIGRVFGNLFSNIVKYARREDEVVIRCREREKHVVVRIENGIRIFEGDKPESTGFGSRISRRLMEEINGEYSAEESGGKYVTILRFLKA